MPSQLSVHLLPELTTQEQLAGDCVVVIDVLRASTTICFALASEATAVVPCLHVTDARELGRKLRGDGEPVVLGGEREGIKLDGFDLGNSPREYLPEAVGGKTVVFTTTNGTKALSQCIAASTVLVGAFVNFSAILEAISQEESIHLLCAGTQGEVTREDALLAGLMGEQLLLDNLSLQVNDQAAIAIDAWQAASGGYRDPQQIHRCLETSQGGRNLQRVGHAADIKVAAAIDVLQVVPQLDKVNWRIQARAGQS